MCSTFRASPRAAAYRKLTGEAPPPWRYGQGYALDLRRPDRAVIAGDGPLGAAYGVRQFLDLLPGGLPRAWVRDYPDFETRLVHQQGFDKGYGAGDHWSLADFEHDVPRYLDFVSAARFTALCLNLEAGWVNQLHGRPVLARLIERARAGMTDIVISLEYAGMPDREATGGSVPPHSPVRTERRGLARRREQACANPSAAPKGWRST